MSGDDDLILPINFSKIKAPIFAGKSKDKVQPKPKIKKPEIVEP